VLTKPELTGSGDTWVLRRRLARNRSGGNGSCCRPGRLHRQVNELNPTPHPPITTSRPHVTTLLAAAHEFLGMFHRESAGGPDALVRRWAEVQAEVARTGTYRHTRAELAFGARAAWRHSVRCVGRVRWPTLVVRDARHLHRPWQLYRQLAKHLRFATNNGRIRSTITIFAPDDEFGPRVRIFNEQLIRYAGWSRPGARPVGDPRYAQFTELATMLGWKPPKERGRWDVLPWIIETAKDEPRVFTVPRAAVLEVPISHPDHHWFAGLGLRWMAVPVISNMRLHIGGVDYSAAPFNGFYLGDEIGSRNLADTDRYDQVPAVAAGLDLDTSSDRSLWRDRGVIELNRAVLHSFDAAKVSIADHHTEARHFMRFASMEEAAGRCPYADATWINSHPAPPQTPTFHRIWDATEVQPNFWLDDDARDRAAGRWNGASLRAQRAAAGVG
jgi:nitric-oxide synthase, bacterial